MLAVSYLNYFRTVGTLVSSWGPEGAPCPTLLILLLSPHPCTVHNIQSLTQTLSYSPALRRNGDSKVSCTVFSHSQFCPSNHVSHKLICILLLSEYIQCWKVFIFLDVMQN